MSLLQEDETEVSSQAPQGNAAVGGVIVFLLHLHVVDLRMLMSALLFLSPSTHTPLSHLSPLESRLSSPPAKRGLGRGERGAVGESTAWQSEVNSPGWYK